jgi:hypothetical protein
MDLWNWLEYGAWGLSALLGLYMAYDWLRTDSTYPEDILTSSREGEIEAIAEEHKAREARRG